MHKQSNDFYAISKVKNIQYIITERETFQILNKISQWQLVLIL